MTYNSITIKTSLLELRSDRPILEPASTLEGFIAKKFPGYSIVHNHIGDKYLYDLPRIQPKIIDGKAYILGIEEGTEILKMMEDIDTLHLGDNIYNIEQKTFYNKDETIMPTREFIQYEFMTPWLPLNKKEKYREFRQLKDRKEKKLFINRTLIGNIISMCKGLGFDVEPNIYVQSKLIEGRSKYIILRTSFTGEFRTNFRIPNLFGIGGKVSVGFGVIKNRDIEQ